MIGRNESLEGRKLEKAIVQMAESGDVYEAYRIDYGSNNSIIAARVEVTKKKSLTYQIKTPAGAFTYIVGRSSPIHSFTGPVRKIQAKKTRKRKRA